MSRRSAVIALVMAVVAAAGGFAFYFYTTWLCCAPPPTPAPPAPTNQAAPAPAAGIRARPEREQLAAAFAAAFGGNGSRSVGDNQYRYEPGGLTWIGDRAVLVSPGTNSQDCHACAGTLAVHYLVPEGDGFRVIGSWLEGGGFADWGRPPEWRFSSELNDQPMLRTQAGGGGQGIFCSGVSFFEFGTSGPREVINVRTGFSSTGFAVPGTHDPPVEVEGQIQNIVPGRSFDVAYAIRHFVQRDREFVPGRVERVTESYVNRGGRYVLASGQSRVPTC